MAKPKDIDDFGLFALTNFDFLMLNKLNLTFPRKPNVMEWTCPLFQGLIADSVSAEYCSTAILLHVCPCVCAQA